MTRPVDCAEVEDGNECKHGMEPDLCDACHVEWCDAIIAERDALQAENAALKAEVYDLKAQAAGLHREVINGTVCYVGEPAVVKADDNGER